MRIAAAVNSVKALYQVGECCTQWHAEAISLEGWEKVITRIAKDMHDGKLRPEDLDEDMIRETYIDLNKKTRAGYGNKWLEINEDTGTPDPVILKMQQNLFKFSGAKTVTQLEELNRALFSNGKRVGWDEFREAALGINRQYNLNHAQAEWQTATQAGLHAQNWAEYQRNKKQFPNLKYKTQGDDRVRKEHEELDGIIAPIDSDFWAKYFPPNGWRCRCYTVQTAEKPTRDIPQDVPGVKKEFRINTGITGQVFNEEDTRVAKAHAFFALSKAIGGRQLKVSFERSKLAAPYNKGVYESRVGKGSIDISPFADIKDMAGNIQTAKTVVDNLGINMKLRPHLDTNIVPGSNPEYEIRGGLADRKADFKPGNYRGINSAFDKAKKQGLEYIVFDFNQSFTSLDITEVNRWVKSNVNERRGKQYKSIIFVWKRKAVEVTREEIVSNELIEALKRLKAEE